MSNSNLVVPELATVEIKGMTRSAFLLRSTLAAGAVYGGAVVGPYVKQAFAQGEGSSGDIDILNFALTLEYLESTFYQEALRQVNGLSGDVQALTEQLEADEAAHVEALTQTISDLGGKPVPAPEVDFGEGFKDEDSYLELSQTFEDTGVSAYNGAAPEIQATEVLAAAGSIVQIEGRHAALIRFTRGEEPAPTAFDETLDMQEVLDAVEPFIVKGN
ncbi:MAG: ferritin-like domain-containing protein [Thermoleophilaceae bacterium]|jgi:rubrerythrin|nr:ferritin-like domain-containing protein [Thermoleophilaceae bacterium]